MAFADIETRASVMDNPKGSIISGYAATFHTEAVIAGEFVEKIQPGAFARSLRENDVVFLLHHDNGRVLARMSNGTLKLAEDAKGLRYELTVDPSTPDGQAVMGLVGRRDLKECSFGFSVRAESWEDGNRLPVRTLTDINLAECSIVTWPAYSNTTAALRSLEAHRASENVRRKIELDLKARRIRLN